MLNVNNYFIFHKGNALYAYKGLLGRIGPIFVHASIIVAFIGFILRMMGGLIIQEMVPNGELFHLQNIVTSGKLSGISNDYVGKVDDFFITFNDDKSVKQFFSNISFINNKKEIIAMKYIWVNSPMKFHGLTIYQTDWQIDALRVQIGQDKYIVKNLKQISLENVGHSSAWACDIIFDKDRQVTVLIPDLLDVLFLYDQNSALIQKTTYGSWTVVYGIPVLFKDLMVSTGLQLKTDPGLSVSYFGFFILMLSIIISYTSYSQIWVNQNIMEVNLSGRTNRALLWFEDELFYISEKMRKLSSSKH